MYFSCSQPSVELGWLLPPHLGCSLRSVLCDEPSIVHPSLPPLALGLRSGRRRGLELRSLRNNQLPRIDRRPTNKETALAICGSGSQGTCGRRCFRPSHVRDVRLHRPIDIRHSWVSIIESPYLDFNLTNSFLVLLVMR